MTITDLNGVPMGVPSALVFTDGASIKSPATPSGGKVILTPPAGAATCIFVTAAGSAQVADTSDSSNGYFPVAASASFRYPCANQKLIYITSSGPVSFMFELL